MKTLIGMSIIGAVLLSTSGCAPIISGTMNMSVTEDVVWDKTSKYFGTNRKNLTITQIEKHALATSYQTKYKGKLYNCSIYYGEVQCKEPGT